MPKQDFLDAKNKVTITIDGDSGSIIIGGNGQRGELRLKNEENKEMAYFSASGQIVISAADGMQRVFLGKGNLHVGGNGTGGDITVHPSTSQVGVYGKVPSPSLRLDGEKAELRLAAGGKNRVRLDGLAADAFIGGNGADGDLFLFDSKGNNTSAAQATIHLDGHAGDIILKNADCAEEFDISDLEDIVAGSVMVLDDEGKLRQSQQPYDRRVAGVISGAGDYRPGIILDRKHAQLDRKPLALVGKVFCRADALYSPIEVGDLLTTSATPGHAMKASDPLRAFGAVIGKALRPLRSGADLIPILVALQ